MQSEFKRAPNLKYLFRPDYNLQGKFGRPNGDLYTEIIKYSDILKRAQLRNQILMEKLEEKPEVEIAAELEYDKDGWYVENHKELEFDTSQLDR